MPSHPKAIGARRGPKVLDFSPATVTLTIVAGVIAGGLVGLVIAGNPFAGNDSTGTGTRPTPPPEKRHANKPKAPAATSEPLVGHQQGKSSKRKPKKQRHTGQRKFGSPSPLPAPTEEGTPGSAGPETPPVPQTPTVGAAPDSGQTGATSPTTTQTGTSGATGTTGP